MNQTMLPFSFLFSVVSGWLIEYVYPPLIFLSNPPTHPPTFYRSAPSMALTRSLLPKPRKQCWPSSVPQGSRKTMGKSPRWLSLAWLSTKSSKPECLGRKEGPSSWPCTMGKGARSASIKSWWRKAWPASASAPTVLWGTSYLPSLSPLYPPTFSILPPTSLPNQPTTHPPTYLHHKQALGRACRHQPGGRDEGSAGSGA